MPRFSILLTLRKFCIFGGIERLRDIVILILPRKSKQSRLNWNWNLETSQRERSSRWHLLFFQLIFKTCDVIWRENSNFKPIVSQFSNSQHIIAIFQTFYTIYQILSILVKNLKNAKFCEFSKFSDFCRFL